MSLQTKKQELTQVQADGELANSKLDPIPQKRYFTIGEVGRLCATKPHVLRYWEREFPQLSPAKRRGGRRYYRYHDVLMVRKIRYLLYEKGFTIEGARSALDSKHQTTKQFAPDMQNFAKELIIELKNVVDLLTEDVT